MHPDDRQLQRNRAKVLTIAAGLFLLGSHGPNVGSLFGHHGGHDRAAARDREDSRIDRIEAAADRATDLADRATELADRAAEAAERAADTAD